MYDSLIHGKNQTPRIVNVEVEDDKATLFIEDEDGNVVTEEHPNRFWILESYSSPGSVKLEGNLHYKYGKQFTSKFKRGDYINSLRKKKADFYTIYDEKESFLTKDGFTLFKGMKHTEPSMLSFDIESTGLFHNKDSKVLLISNTFRKNGVITRKLFAYDEYSSQAKMIDAWCNWIREMDPSIILGHNVYTFDFPYLAHVAKMNDTQLLLGRNGSPIYINSKSSQFRVDGSRSQEYNRIRIYGRDVIDTMFLTIKWDIGRQLTSYGLKSIIKELNLEKEGRTFYDAGEIRHKYKDPDEWSKIKEYCSDDSDDSLNLYDKVAAAFFYMTQCIPKTFQGVIESASGSQLNMMMVRSYLQDGHSIPKASLVKKYRGAISAGLPGVYKNVKKWDVVSEYPSIIITYDVYDPDKDPKANLIKLTNYFFKERIHYKSLFKKTNEEQYDAIQNCFKVLLNSLYGFLGSEGTNFNFPEGAEFVTMRGREIVSIAVEWATSKKYQDWVIEE